MRLIKENKLVKNTVMLYAMKISMIVFPLITLPYLTRVLSIETYGGVAYIKSCMTYVALLVDFGFMLSSTREIILAREEKSEINNIITDTTIARLFLLLIAAGVMLCFSVKIELLHGYEYYIFISTISIGVNIFLFDYFFQAIERMEYISIRYILTKSVSVLFTFILVKNDNDIIWIAYLDLISSLLASSYSFYFLRKNGVVFHYRGLKKVWNRLKYSMSFFISMAASTGFSGLNTIIIGIYLSPKEVAYWTIAIQVISGIQALYTPITQSLYPYMIKTQDKKMGERLIGGGTWIIILISFFVYIFANNILVLLSGEQYMDAAYVLRMLLPVLIFSYPAVMLGWPTLGAFGLVREVSFTTFLASFIQVCSLVVLIVLNVFSFYSVLIVRCLSEFVLMISRGIIFKLKI